MNRETAVREKIEKIETDDHAVMQNLRNQKLQFAGMSESGSPIDFCQFFALAKSLTNSMYTR